MSYDLELYSCDMPVIDERRLSAGKTWVVNMQGPDTIDIEDIPEALINEIPNLQYFTAFTIEGDAPAKVFSETQKILMTLTNTSKGLLFDPQTGLVERLGDLPKLVDTLGKFPRSYVTDESSDPSPITLSWWFLDSQAVLSGGYERIVETIEETAPELMPRRYGPYEPPPYKYEETGREHFLEFLAENLTDIFVWYPHKPFTHIHASIPPEPGPSPQGFRSCYFTIEVDAVIMESTDWIAITKRLWLNLSKVLQPFYSEIRYGESPVRSWFWKGIPPTNGYAVLIGEPYTDLWPEFVAVAKSIPGGLFYIDALESKHRPIAVQPPAAITQPTTGDYPGVWPFDGPLPKDFEPVTLPNFEIYLESASKPQVSDHERDKLLPIHMAAVEGDLEALVAQIAEGVSVDTQEIVKGNTPLILAAFHDHHDLVGYLIHQGADIEARCFAGETALHKAAWNGSDRSARLLIEAGASVEPEHSDGFTPLIMAAFKGHLQMAQLLVLAGASTKSTDFRGYTALAYAFREEHPVTASFLKAAQLVEEGDYHTIEEVPISAVTYGDFLEETETHLAVKKIKSLLLEIFSEIDSGFPKSNVSRLRKKAHRLKLGGYIVDEYDTTFKGSRMPLVIGIIKDRANAFRLRFFSHAALIDMIKRQIADLPIA